MIHLRRSVVAAGGLFLLLGSSAEFLTATERFYGTTFPTLAEALARPATGPLSDDVYLCSRLNGLGSDDQIFVAMLWALLPLLIWRLWHLRRPPGWGEAAIFVALSLPALLMSYDMTCADIPLTIAMGNALAPIGCALGWLLAAAAYFWPFRDR